MTSTFHACEAGFTVYGLRSDTAEITVVPELGARILGLRDLRTGRQWLDRPLGPVLFRNAFADDFNNSTFAGADECIPTICQCRWNNRDLPDHGEVWALPWELDAAAWAEGTLQTRIPLPLTPLDFTRTITLDGEWVTLAYAVTNRAAEPEEYLWAFHPLFALAEGDRLELPDHIRSVRAAGADGVPDASTDIPWAWPEPFPGVRLDRLDFGGEGYAKLFAGPLTTGYAAILGQTTGCSLELHWSPGENPWLGIWLTRGAFRGFHHVALEPTNGDADDLETAAGRPGGLPRLDPGATATWTVRLRLGRL